MRFQVLHLALLASAALQASAPFAAGASDAQGGELQLPEGPARAAFERARDAKAPVQLHAALGEAASFLFEPDAPEEPGEAAARRWATWGAWLSEAARAEGAPAHARAGLALIAARDGRWTDAWRALEGLADEPAWVAALAPHFLPGAPLDATAARGGLSQPLPDGVVLAPALPPPAAPESPWTPGPRRALVRGFCVGEALLELEVQVEPSGVQIDVRHLSGGPARLSVLLPEPEDQEIRLEYLDWFRTEELRVPHAIELAPGDEPRTLFGRFFDRSTSLPANPRGPLPRTIELGGIWLELADPLAAGPAPRAAAAALARVLGVPTGLCAPLDPPPAGAYAGVVLHLAPGPAGDRLLARVASAAEAYLLRRPR